MTEPSRQQDDSPEVSTSGEPSAGAPDGATLVEPDGATLVEEPETAEELIAQWEADNPPQAATSPLPSS